MQQNRYTLQLSHEVYITLHVIRVGLCREQVADVSSAFSTKKILSISHKLKLLHPEDDY